MHMFFWNLYFNTSYVTVQHRKTPSTFFKGRIFQYILCYGSTKPTCSSCAGCANFNTSYVTVQRFSPIFFNPSWRISIHPMLRFNVSHDLKVIVPQTNFNTSYVTVQRSVLGIRTLRTSIFQYILCYGSTLLLNPLKFLNKLFQYILCYGSTKIKFLGFLCQVHFNTSYVTVQQM